MGRATVGRGSLMGLKIRHPQETEHEQLDVMSAQAFTAAAPTHDPGGSAWTPPLDRRWVAESEGRLVGKLAVWSMGHWLDGRCVPMSGVAGVAVDPAARGAGVARSLLTRMLHELRDQGQPMTSLFPMNLGLYRKSGWEIGGTWPQCRIAAAALARLPRPTERLVVRPSALDDLDAVIAVYDEVARHEPGMLQRERIKCRPLVAPKQPGYGYVVLRGERVVGYVSYTHASTQQRSGMYDFEVTELVGLDGDATLTLWHLLGSSAPAAADVVAVLGPSDPLHLLLPERAIIAAEHWWWLTRLVDAPAAVAARGWRPGPAAQVELDIVDPVLDANNGPHVLTVADGRGHLEPGGAGRVRLGIGTLSSLFTGWADARQLWVAGLLPGADDTDVAALAAALGGRTPWIRTFF